MDLKSPTIINPVTLPVSLGVADEKVGDGKGKRVDSRAFPRQKCAAKETCIHKCNSAPGIKTHAALFKAFPFYQEG